MTLLSFLVAPVSGKLAERLGIRWFLGAGLFCVGLGLFLMSGLEPGDDWTALLAGFLVAGGGIGLVNPPLATAAVGVVEPQRAGMASGINSTFRQVGIATGIAALGRDLPAPRGLELPRRACRPRGCRRACARTRSRTSSPSAARSASATGALSRAAEQAFVHGLNHILVYAAIARLRRRGARHGADPPAGLHRARFRSRGMIPLTAQAFAEAAANLYDGMLGEGLADLRRMPSTVIDEGPQRTVHRYHPAEAAPRGRRAAALPVLLVPPLAAPAICFDLRRGCSVAEHLVLGGHPTYLVDYGEIEFADRALGLEHWIDDVVPRAIRAASEDAGGRPVQVVGWCLGGILSLLALAADRAAAGRRRRR